MGSKITKMGVTYWNHHLSSYFLVIKGAISFGYLDKLYNDETINFTPFIFHRAGLIYRWKDSFLAFLTPTFFAFSTLGTLTCCLQKIKKIGLVGHEISQFSKSRIWFAKSVFTKNGKKNGFCQVNGWCNLISNYKKHILVQIPHKGNDEISRYDKKAHLGHFWHFLGLNSPK